MTEAEALIKEIKKMTVQRVIDYLTVEFLKDYDPNSKTEQEQIIFDIQENLFYAMDKLTE